jgi:DNA helicase-2/ATP-dependent DNA helicase PcrA
MTIHGSKGLEFKQVFVVGMEENLFPSQMMLKNREDLEEERRLFYVAITRAEKKLTLSYAEQRYNWGKLTFCEKSRFIDEIDPRYLKTFEREVTQIRTFEIPKNVAKWDIPVRSAPSTKSQTISNLKPVIQAKQTEAHIPSEDFKPSDTSKLKAGDKVEHPKFGYGDVKKVEVQGPTSKAIIYFEKEGEKTLLLSFAKLRIV